LEINYSSCTGKSSEKKKYVAAVEALRKKEREDETQFTTKIGGFLSFTSPPPPNANVLFCRFFKNLTLVYNQTQGSSAVFVLLYG
jgi:hypothetical protein